jgi:hypothetical protein
MKKKSNASAIEEEQRERDQKLDYREAMQSKSPRLRLQ